MGYCPTRSGANEEVRSAVKEEQGMRFHRGVRVIKEWKSKNAAKVLNARKPVSDNDPMILLTHSPRRDLDTV
ncbi:hypothetical protein TNCV_4926991 [Trichonephila clavipes]|nr:hypothetical protein TNCV_4926991 [Trichonephila clavipes]